MEIDYSSIKVIGFDADDTLWVNETYFREAEITFSKADAKSHTETWADMVRLQETGIYPAAFAAITAPVLMLHGKFDPHPGQLIRASLLPYLAHLDSHEFERCGHYPWLERAAKQEFRTVLRNWLRLQLGLIAA